MLFSERRDAGHVGRFSLGVATLVGRVDAQAPASPRRITKSSPLQSFVASRCPRARFVALRAAISPCYSRAHVKGSCIGKLTRFSWRYCARGIPTESASTISRKLHITRAVVHPLRIIRLIRRRPKCATLPQGFPQVWKAISLSDPDIPCCTSDLARCFEFPQRQARSRPSGPRSNTQGAHDKRGRCGSPAT